MIEGDTDKRAGFRLVIWSTLAAMGDATASELAQEMKRRVTVIRPRLTEMLDLMEIRETGDKRNGGKRGPRERVVEVVDKADQLASE